MTDYFALLNLPQRPWVELEQLKANFHAQARQVHPDAKIQQVGDSSSDAQFAQLNEGYQVLQDPKRRLQHLLTLCGHPPAKTPESVPREIGELFPLVAAATQAAEAIAQKLATGTTTLARSLLKGEALQTSRQVTALLERLSVLQKEAMAELRRVDLEWQGAADMKQLHSLQRLYVLFSYVTRWMAELQEKNTQLAAA